MNQSYFNKDEVKTPYWNNKIAIRMIDFVKPYKKKLFLALFFVIAGAVTSSTLPWILGKAVDEGIKIRSADILIKFVIIYILVQVLNFIIISFRSRTLQFMGTNILHDMRTKLFEHMQTLPISFFDKNPVGRLVIRVTSDVTTIAEMFSGTLIGVIAEIFIMFGIAAMMLWLNWKLALAALLITPLLYIMVTKLRMKMHESFKLSRIKLASLNSELAENISGINIIRIFNQEKKQSKKFDILNNDLKDAEMKAVHYNALFMPTTRFCTTIAVSIVLTYGCYLISAKELTVGLLIAFISYTQQFFEPVRQLCEQLSMFQSAMASAERVFDMFDEKPESDLETGKTFTEMNDKLEFKHLNFSYNPEKQILYDISFTVKKGEKVAIVGHTGAGKTTISSILKRFYDYSDGNILIDGIELKDYSKKSLRKKIGLIQQDVNIFSGSLLNNIFLDNTPETEPQNKEKLNKIIKELEMEKLLKNLTNEDSVEINERGKNLSAGQRQLIAFARALATKPEILILDEATSSMDSETENIIQNATQRITQTRTCIIIAHRLSTIKNCDRILMLDNGRLVEEGTHDDLLRKKGYYHKLYELQFAK